MTILVRMVSLQSERGLEIMAKKEKVTLTPEEIEAKKARKKEKRKIFGKTFERAIAWMLAVVLVYCVTYMALSNKTLGAASAAPAQSSAQTTQPATKSDWDTSASGNGSSQSGSQSSASGDSASGGNAAQGADAASPAAASDVAAVVEKFKSAALNSEDVPKYQNMTLRDYNFSSNLVNSLMGIAEGLISKNSGKENTASTGLSGGIEQLTADDVKSATMSTNGGKTTVHIELKEQTDGADGQAHEGPVGHGIGVLGGIDEVVSNFPGVTVNDIELVYQNPVIDVVIDDASNKVESGKESYTVFINLKSAKVAISTLSGTAYIDYEYIIGE